MRWQTCRTHGHRRRVASRRALPRQVFLGDALDSERLQANCRHGVLTLTIPVAEAAKPRRVPVGGGQDAQTIEPLTAGGAEAGPAERPVSTAGNAVPRGEG